jgi:hypothetical protein
MRPFSDWWQSSCHLPNKINANLGGYFCPRLCKRKAPYTVLRDPVDDF